MLHRRARLTSLIFSPIVLFGLGGAEHEAHADGGARAILLDARSLTLPGVRVMTQNLYVGLDVFAIIGAAPEDIPFAVADGFADVVANRPAERLSAVAREIALVQPHLVGLQEVVELFEQSPSDAILGNLTPNATDPVVSFLDVLLAELARYGVRYEVAASQAGADIELPRFDGVVDGEPTFTDVRSRFSDVILRREGIATSPLFEINYAVGLPIPTLPGVVVQRNAVGVTATVGGDTFRFVSTQLEPLVPGLPDTSQPQLGQALELIDRLAADRESPTIVVGDFNSEAEVGTTYQLMASAGYTDVWNIAHDLGQSGLTCCQEVVLDNPRSALSQRIDYVWTSHLAARAPVVAFTVGDQPFFRTPSRPHLWPSDHAGLVSHLRF